MPGLEFPAIIEIEAVGAIAILFANRSVKPADLASGQDPFSFAIFLLASSAFVLI